jgi:hypothetical protein
VHDRQRGGGSGGHAGHQGCQRREQGRAAPIHDLSPNASGTKSPGNDNILVTGGQVRDIQS